MEEDKGSAAAAARGPSSLPPPSLIPLASSSSHAPAEETARASAGQRQMFSVELRPGETTIVSWKRLVRDSYRANGEVPAPSLARPALESIIGPAPAAQTMECEKPDAQPPPNRFSAVIEKIERLYMGRESSDDEDLGDIPDDDQYDTEDSFIDDAELDEYFEVEKSSTKHNGFFVNRGALEQIETSSQVPNLAPRKRRRKDKANVPSAKDGSHMTHELVGNVRMKAAARNAPIGRKSLSTMKVLGSFADHYQEGKGLKNKLSTSLEVCKRKSADHAIKSSGLSSTSVQNKDVLPSSSENKASQNQRPAAAQFNDSANKLRKTESFDSTNLSSREKGVTHQVESQFLSNKGNDTLFTKSRPTEKNGMVVLPDLNSPGNAYPIQGMKSSHFKEGSGIIRPKGTTLERAIRDLEKIVAACRLSNLDVQEFDASSLVKKRLPQEVKQKLAKVARLAASQGKVREEDLLDRLMGIVGHLVQRKTLKRNLKEMVELGISAKQIKADRFQQIKKEVIDMIKMRIMNSKTKGSEQQDGPSDDFHDVTSEERRALKAKYSMDDALEDKICDLYDLYVEGMDEDKGPQMRKLYVELAELWPYGYMDNVGIKDVIFRAKGRKKALYRQKDRNNEERIRRKKMSAPVRVDDNVTLGLQAPTPQDILDSNGQKVLSADRGSSGQPLPQGRMSEHANTCSNGYGLSLGLGLKNLDKARGGGPGAASEDAAALKKKMKRKAEAAEAGGDDHPYPVKPPSHPNH